MLYKIFFYHMGYFFFLLGSPEWNLRDLELELEMKENPIV